MAVRNVVFDIGGVLIRWDPLYIVRCTFADRHADPDSMIVLFADNEIWRGLNRGEISCGNKAGVPASPRSQR